MTLLELKLQAQEAWDAFDASTSAAYRLNALIDAEREKALQAFDMANAELISQAADIVRQADNAKAEAEKAEEALRLAMIETYTANPTTKQLGNGLSVRVTTNYNYDEKDAIKWAIAHEMPSLLKVHASNFKKQAALTEMDFVTKTEAVSAVISWEVEDA